MLAVLPLVLFGLTLLYLGATTGLRGAFVKASVVWGLVVVASTEALSPLRALSLPALTAVWTLASIAAGVGVWQRRGVLAERLRPAVAGRQWWVFALALGPIAVIAAAVGGVALGAPPHPHDSMGFLQASSTQTDYVVAFWLVCSVSLALTTVTQRTPQSAAWFASSLGLAMLTKGTAYIFAAPMVLALGYWMVTRLRSRLIWSALLMLLIPPAINAGYYARNQTVFHNPLAPGADNAQLANATYSPQAIVSTVIRDGVVQFGTPSANLNGWLERGIARVHSQVLHIGLSDPATTFPDATFHVNPLSM